jgi:hypothetical protein
MMKNTLKSDLTGTDMPIRDQQSLVSICLALIGDLSRLSTAERKLVRQLGAEEADAKVARRVRQSILKRHDPLGDAFTEIRSGLERRETGAVYTPVRIVRSMLRWVEKQGKPTRVVDPGAGSGRFILAAGEVFPKAQLVAVENDPLAALMLRANISARGWTKRTTLHVCDYRALKLSAHRGKTAFVGNPPYVRHHGISERWKAWYAKRFASYGIDASGLAGLHLHFFLQTRLLARVGDIGSFITSAEWMDVNYGNALRRLLIEQLGGVALHVLEPTVAAFPGTATTAAISCFRVGELKEPVRVRSVAELSSLNGLSKGKAIERVRFGTERRWSTIVRPQEAHRDGEIELGELFRVHRGQVTGANGIWIAGEQAEVLPDRVRLPAVTKARDLIEAGAQLGSADALRRVIDLPAELDDFSSEEKKRIQKFLKWAKDQGADQGYIAQHRKAWWAVGLKEPAPILCTYMARRSPQFTLNACAARHINIAHGLYPREDLAPETLTAMVQWLNDNISVASGRTYAGGLTKFEPKEIERLRVPKLESLVA